MAALEWTVSANEASYNAGLTTINALDIAVLTSRTPTRHLAGFTLIELITVITILGILSATALPRFVNLRKDSILATTQGLRGALQSAAELGHAKAAIAGITDLPSATLTINGTPVPRNAA